MRWQRAKWFCDTAYSRYPSTAATLILIWYYSFAFVDCFYWFESLIMHTQMSGNLLSRRLISSFHFRCVCVSLTELSSMLLVSVVDVILVAMVVIHLDYWMAIIMLNVTLSSENDDWFIMYIIPSFARIHSFTLWRWSVCAVHVYAIKRRNLSQSIQFDVCLACRWWMTKISAAHNQLNQQHIWYL